MTDESLIREVDDEVRQEEFKKLWQRHGTKITALVVAIVAGVAAFKGYEYYLLKQSEEASVVYLDAVKKATDGKNDDALAALAAVKHAGFGQLAKLQEAAVLAQKGETEKAIAAYDGLANDGSSDAALADLARIRAGYLLIDTTTPDALLSRLGKFDKEDSIWRNEAREIFGLAAWRVKDYVMADRYMNAIFADPESSQAIRQRAQVMIQLIAPNLPKS